MSNPAVFHLVKVRFDRRTPAIDQQWLDRRYRFFGQYTLPSLLAQTSQDWTLWINCDSGMREMAGELQKVLANYEIHPIWTFGDGPPTIKEILQAGIMLGEDIRSAEYVYVTRLDSDDVLAPDALALAAAIQPKELGRVEASIFRRGYMYELPGISTPQESKGRLGVYYNPSSPFHTLMIPKDTFVDPEAYRREVWDKAGDHSRVGAAFHVHSLPDWRFCVLVHGHNFISDFSYSKEDRIPYSWLERGWSLERFLQQPLVFDVDDFCDEMGGVKGETVLQQLDNLKLHYPHFRCTLFTVPQRTNKPLLYRARQRDWIELAVHGIAHIPDLELKVVPPAELLQYLSSVDYSIYAQGFKPPGWHMDLEHVLACNQAGLWVALNDRDRKTFGPECTNGYYVCGERLPYWHGHTHNVCGNWLQRHLPDLLKKWHPTQRFSFVSEAVLVAPERHTL